MRVLSVFTLLCVCVLGVTGQYTLDGSSNASSGWFLTGGSFGTTATGPNPVLTFNAGNTYNFTVSAGVDANHPFAFSSQQNGGATTITAVDTTVYTVTPNGCGGTGTTGDGYKNAGCVISIAVVANATNSTIYYKCTLHPAMTGQINVVAVPAAGATTAAPTTAAPTTAAPTTAAPTTAAPTGPTTAAPTGPTTAAPTGPTTAAPTGPTTAAPTGPTTAAPTTSAPTNGSATTAAPTTTSPTTTSPTTNAPTTPAPTSGTIVSNTFHITNNDGTNAYLFTHNGVVYSNPTLQATAGSPITISFEWPRSYNHPFGFSNDSSPTAAIAATTQFFPDLPADAFTITTTATCDTTYGPSQNTTVKTVRAINDTTISTTKPCTITIPTATSDAGGLVYYRCARHPKMVGILKLVAGNGNSASTITISGLTFIVAIIAAIMA